MDFDNKFKELKDALQILNDYYIDTRYPDMWDRYPFEDEKLALEAIEQAKYIFNFVNKTLSL